MDGTEPDAPALIHIIRHGESLHNIHRGYPHRDPPLTDAGREAAKGIQIPDPDLIVISPMTRTIETAIIAFPSILGPDPSQTAEVQIWPDLREAHDAICNIGVSRAEIAKKFPQFSFAECPEEWNHPPHTAGSALERAAEVRHRLKELSKTHRSIAVITHRGFIAFLAKGVRYGVCEARSYRFATDDESQKDSLRLGVNVDSLEPQDFGPTLLVPFEVPEKCED